MNISLDYPLWYLLLCVALGLVYALILYFKDNTFKEESGWRKNLNWILFPLRFVTASGIAMLLLSPLTKQRFTDIQKPYILIAQDNSQSIQKAIEEDKGNEIENQIATIEEELKEAYEVQKFIFDTNIKENEQTDYSGKITNLSGMMNDLYDRYSYQNVGAVVLASDGIYNEGVNPVYSNFQLDVPIYTIALGDTVAKRDVKINQVLHNRIAYAGDKTTIRIDVSAINAKGTTTTLNVYAGKGTKNRVSTQVIKIDKDKFFNSKEVVLKPSGKGIQTYTISLTGVENEVTKDNNFKNIYIDVIDGKQKISILAAVPHPDVSALKQAIENGRNYEVDVQYITDFDGKISGKDLFIMHGLPAKNRSIDDIAGKLKANRIPALYVISGSTDLGALNNLQNVIKAAGFGSSVNKSKAKVNANFNLFTYDAVLAQDMQALPPLDSPFAEWSASSTAQVLMYQKVGTVETNYPLLAFEQAGNYKTGVLCGEGLWKWRILDYTKDKNFETVDELISKTVQYLAIKNDKRQFRVSQADNLFNENETINFGAELYNDSYELVNDPDAQITILSESGEAYPFTFSKNLNAYELNAGVLPVGDYSYTGQVNYNGKALKSNGNFTVKPLQLEALNTTANHQLLNSLSKKFGGEMVYPAQIASLVNKIKENKNIKPLMYSTYKTEPIINYKWLLGLLMLLLTIEWFFRKFGGSY